MDSRIEQAVNETLAGLDKGSDLQVGAAFADELTRKMAQTHMARAITYPKMLYPATVVLMVLLNVAALVLSFSSRPEGAPETTDATRIMASEYGLEQSDYLKF